MIEEQAIEPLNTDYFPSIKELILLNKYPDEQLALELLFKRRFGNTCPRCHRSTGKFVFAIVPSQAQAFTHTSCSKQISPRAGTMFAHSLTPLTVWYQAIYITLIEDGHPSPKRTARQLGVHPNTARVMYTRIIDYLGFNADERTLSRPPIEAKDA